jgi:Mg2+-importing ATPase
MILSINLSKGAVTMSKKGVIVKRLSSIENFGAMDVLCSDKTGTLTENRIVLFKHVDYEGRDNERVFEYAYLNSHFQSALHNLMDNAILTHHPTDTTKDLKIDEIPFDFNRKRVSVVLQHRGARLLITKGAPEEIFKSCDSYDSVGKISRFTKTARAKAEMEYRKLSKQGFMVLGVAYKRVAARKSKFAVADEEEMVFLGFVGFLDPPKESAKESLRLLHATGVELKILTGDNELVTRKVCEEIGFEIKGVLLGSDMEGMDDEELGRQVEHVNIFARVTPSEKNRIMHALKRNGHVVGFMGDGINDTPSMRVADVSISVDNAVDIAKESADIILLRQDLHVLKEGVIEGRKTFGNTMKYIMMELSSNFGNMFSAAVASLFLPFLPMLPLQILLNNLIYDISQITIPLDSVDDEFVRRPKKMDVKFLRRFMLVFGPISSIFDFLTFFVLLVVFGASAAIFQTGWFIESLCTQTLIIFAIRTRQPFYKSKPSRYLVATMLIMVVVAIAIPYSPLAQYFQFVPPPPFFLAVVLIFSVVYFAIVELVKWWFYRKYGME